MCIMWLYNNSLEHSLEEAVKGIGFFLNSEEIKFICFKQGGVISSANGKPMKLAEQTIYLGCNISSTESDSNIRQGKSRSDIKKLIVIRNLIK